MARIYTEGFERNFSKWDVYGGTVTIENNTGFAMGGSKCVKLDGNNVYIRGTFDDLATYYLSFFIRFYNVTSTSSNVTWLEFLNSANTTIGAVCFTGGGTNRICRLIRSTTTVASGTTSLALDTTYHIAIKYTPHISAGEFQLYLNDVLEVNASGIQTATATNNINKISFGVNSTTRANFYLDDVIMDSAELINSAHKIFTLTPAATAGSDQWTAYDGITAKPTCVLDDDSSYIYTPNLNEIQEFTFSAPPNISVSSIHNVSPKALVSRYGPTKNVSVGVNDDYDTGSLANFLVPSYIERCVTLNPSTSAAWSMSDLNTVKAGVKSLTS